MLTCDDELDEYEVKIDYKLGKTIKTKMLRILNLRRCPSLQLISVKNPNQIKDVPISKASKVFLGFSLKENEEYFKLILKKYVITVYFTDKQKFEECFQRINQMLELYRRRESGISITSNISSEKDSNSDRISSGIPNADGIRGSRKSSEPSVIPKVDDIPGSRKQSDGSSETFITMRDPRLRTISQDTYVDLPNHIDEDTYKHVFQKDYEVPNFDENMPALIGGNDSLEISKKSGTFRMNNPQIFEVMKLREEICNIGGVEVQLPCNLERAFLIKQIDGKFWVSSIPRWVNIEGKLHVGDRIISVNGQRISNMLQFQQLTMRGNNYSLKIQRLPKAKVFVFDKTVFDAKKAITYKNKSFFFSDATKVKWRITEISRINTVNIVDSNKIENIQAVVNSDLGYLTLIIHPLDFMKSLKE